MHKGYAPILCVASLLVSRDLPETLDSLAQSKWTMSPGLATRSSAECAWDESNGIGRTGFCLAVLSGALDAAADTRISGEITAEYEDETSALAGRTSLCIVDYARAKYECGLTLHDVLDGDSITYSYAPGLLGRDGDLKSAFEDMHVERILIICKSQLKS